MIIWKQLLARLTGSPVTTGSGSAFVKVAEADQKELEIKGRIVAINAANKAKLDAMTHYHREVSRLHLDADTVKDGFDTILSKL